MAKLPRRILLLLLLLLLLGLILLVGCKTAPTKVAETQHREFELVKEKALKPIDLTENTVILDVRSAFEYGLNRVQNSQHFPWDRLAESAATGEILRDRRQAALRLSLVGLTPTTPVLIVGYGQVGNGEEARLAWTLLFLGFQDVQVSAVEAFRKSLTQVSSPPALNVPTFAANPRDELQLSREDFLAEAADPANANAYANANANKAHAVWLDVRSEKEFRQPLRLTDKGQPVVPPQTKNIEWKRFYTAHGRPDWRYKDKLLAMGINPTDHIVVVSNRGVRSAAAAYALLAMGYPNVQNFTSGWNSLR